MGAPTRPRLARRRSQSRNRCTTNTPFVQLALAICPFAVGHHVVEEAGRVRGGVDQRADRPRAGSPTGSSERRTYTDTQREPGQPGRSRRLSRHNPQVDAADGSRSFSSRSRSPVRGPLHIHNGSDKPAKRGWTGCCATSRTGGHPSRPTPRRTRPQSWAMPDAPFDRAARGVGAVFNGTSPRGGE